MHFFCVKEYCIMKNNQNLLRITFMGMMIALGVVISPILRVEGMCPMAHLINVT